MPNYVGGDRPGGGGGEPDLRGDLLAFSVARQAALGQEEIFRAVKALRDENDKLVERCKALGREVSLTQAENKQLAGHISRVLGLVTSFTQAQASSNNEVRSVLTAQVLALTEHVSALTKQFTIFQLDQRQHLADERAAQAGGSRRGSLAPGGAGSGAGGDAAAQRRQLCDVYIALCDSVRATPSGSVLSALTTGARTLTLALTDLRDLWALTKALKSSVDVPDEATRQQWEAEAAAASEAAAAPVLSRMTELLTAMDSRAAVEVVLPAAELDLAGAATADEFDARVAASATAEGVGDDGAVAAAEAPGAVGTGGGEDVSTEAQEMLRQADAEVDGDGGGEAAAAAAAAAGAEEQQEAEEVSELGLDDREREEEPQAEPAAARVLTPPPPPPVSAVKHLRIRGDSELCVSEEALDLLTDLFSCYRVETVELPSVSRAVGRGGTAAAEAGEGDETSAGGQREEELGLEVAARGWAAQAGVSLVRR